MTVDLLVVGRIVTLAGGGADDLGIVEALAIEDGRVRAAGRLSDVEGLAGPGTRRLHLGPDEIALPGLTDGHLHLADAAVAAVQLDLEAAATLGAGLERIRAAHVALADPAAWLRGGGWDAGRWGAWPTADVDVQTAPTAGDLEVADRLRRTDRPIMLIANKCDDWAPEAAAQNLASLGFGHGPRRLRPARPRASATCWTPSWSGCPRRPERGPRWIWSAPAICIMDRRTWARARS